MKISSNLSNTYLNSFGIHIVFARNFFAIVIHFWKKSFEVYWMKEVK